MSTDSLKQLTQALRPRGAEGRNEPNACKYVVPPVAEYMLREGRGRQVTWESSEKRTGARQRRASTHGMDGDSTVCWTAGRNAIVALPVPAHGDIFIAERRACLLSDFHVALGARVRV